MKSMKKGFTLVELMVVIVIIGILAALAIPRFLGATNKSKAAEFKPVLKQIYTLQEAYRQEKDAYASAAADIGFDAPEKTQARFEYDVFATPVKLGQAKALAGKIKDVDGKDVKDQLGCVDSANTLTVSAAGLGSVSNLSVGTNCKL